MPDGDLQGRVDLRPSGVSEVVGTLILVGLIMIGIVLVSILLNSNPGPSSIPAFDGIISNNSTAIYIYHKGGDDLQPGQFQILVNGGDQTANFTIMGVGSPFTYPWTVGETLKATSPVMPTLVVLVFNRSPGGQILLSADLTQVARRLPTFYQANALNAAAVAFPAASVAGDLIVVSSYWSSQAVTITSVTDSQGNTYKPAVGPTNWGTGSSGATYYASNILGGATLTITVTFSGAQGGTVTYITEYQGVAASRPLDQATATAGNGSVMNSGSVFTGQGTELIYGSGMANGTATVSSPYTARSTYATNFTADQTVTSTNYYAVTGTNSGGGAWLCQIATFRGW